uniref:Pancreatic trypsin inhibitor n=1 Tax=Rhipicephalus zambeziensis TaxID=60191 RepID=A0A224Y288_9ACAR
MVLRCIAFTFIVTSTWVHASPQMLPRLCKGPLLRGSCRMLNASWHLQCQTHKCFMLPNVLCSRGPGVFLTEKLCLNAARQFTVKKQLQGCLQMSTTGGCRPQNHQWYFDSNQRTCRAFHYRDCTTGGNHFVSERKCKEACMSSRKPKIPTQNKIPQGIPHALQTQQARLHRA